MTLPMDANSLDAAILDFDTIMIAPAFLPRLPTITTLPMVPLPPPQEQNTDGIHAKIRDTNPHIWADVTPTDDWQAQEAPASLSLPAPQSVTQTPSHKEIPLMNPDMFDLDTDTALLEDVRASYGAPPSPPQREEEQDRAGQGAEGAEAEEAEEQEAPQPQGYQRPSWVKADPTNENAFWVEHPETTGRFVVEKPTLRRELALERIKGREMGAFPTLEGENLADAFATMSVGFSEIPDNAPRIKDANGKPSNTFDAGELIDEELMNVLYWEVTSAWGRFREAKKPSPTI